MSLANNFKPLTLCNRYASIFLSAFFTLLINLTTATGEAPKNVIPANQSPLLEVFPPSPSERTQTGTGKFVIFTREKVGTEWDFIAAAWECIPSQAETPITKRVEFCHSSWYATPLLDCSVADKSQGLHPRFVRLQVDNQEHCYDVNLYDINYKSWNVFCLWRGRRLSKFGMIGQSIYCHDDKDWMIVDAITGEISHDISFQPIKVENDFWLVQKPENSNVCWSYDPQARRYLGKFNKIETPKMGYYRSILSDDGKNRAWILAAMPEGWAGGKVAGQLILQRDGEPEDLSYPVEMLAVPGSTSPMLPAGVYLGFTPEGQLHFRARLEEKTAKDRVWTVDINTGTVSSTDRPHTKPMDKEKPYIGGVPVPDYLSEYVSSFSHFGRGGLAPAFLLHLGVIKEKPSYDDCIVGISPDGRHILYKAKNGPLQDVFIYGDLLTKKTLSWKSPESLRRCNAMEFAWVETP